MKRKIKIMKNQTSNRKSKIIHLIAACVILAAFGPPAAAPSRAQGPPGPIDQTFTLPGGVFCGFDVQVHVTGREGVINLPSGGLILTGVDFSATFTNLSDPTKSVTLNLAGAVHFSFDQNGNTIERSTGRNATIDPSVGLLFIIGDFTFVYDSNGNLISETGNGTSTDICGLIN
jgi:hypothetical protein